MVAITLRGQSEHSWAEVTAGEERVGGGRRGDDQVLGRKEQEGGCRQSF